VREFRAARIFDADLLIVDGDPVADIDTLLRPRAVHLAGSSL
jgi:hypothetical protein